MQELVCHKHDLLGQEENQTKLYDCMIWKDSVKSRRSPKCNVNHADPEFFPNLITQVATEARGQKQREI